jgi:hypothetical protein
MPLKNSKSKTEILKSSSIALSNAEANPVIKHLMENLGYTKAKINQGKAILEEAKAQYQHNHTLDDEKASAYKAFNDKKVQLESTYAKDRRKVKIICKQDPLILKELGIKGIIPKSYAQWLATVRQLYSTLNTQPVLLNKLASLQITPAQITEALEAIHALENLKAAYILLKGTAQNATQTKNSAFKSLDNYMRTFFAVARIALEREPKLLEALGKRVRT